MEISETELFLAYRQAKCALHQERQGIGRIRLARSEQRLPALIRDLRERLRKSPGWFTGLDLGELWLVPKRATPSPNRSGVSYIGGDSISKLKRLDLRPHLAPSSAFAIVEIL